MCVDVVDLLWLSPYSSYIYTIMLELFQIFINFFYMYIDPLQECWSAILKSELQGETPQK